MASSEHLRSTCSHCSAKFRFPTRLLGRDASCPRCGETVVLFSDGVRAVAAFYDDVLQEYYDQVTASAERSGVKRKRTWKLECGSYLLFVLDFTMTRVNVDDHVAQQIVSLCHRVTNLLDNKQVTRLLQARLEQYGVLSRKATDMGDLSVRCNASLFQHLLRATDDVESSPLRDQPMAGIGAFAAFESRSTLSVCEVCVVVPFAAAIVHLFRTITNVSHTDFDTVEAQLEKGWENAQRHRL
ncbi:MAG: hypothetical protein WD294_09730 [Phycisphaeraceae bacterium]